MMRYLLLSIGLGLCFSFTQVSAYINLQITKTSQREYAAQGDERVRYTIDIANLGVSTATGIRLTDFIMPGLSYQSVSALYSSNNVTIGLPGSQNTTSVGTTSVRELPAMAPNQTTRLIYSARILTPEVSNGLILYLDAQNITAGFDGANNLTTRTDRSSFNNTVFGEGGASPVYSLFWNQTPSFRSTVTSTTNQYLSKAGGLNGGSNLNGISIIAVIKPQSSPVGAVTDIISHPSSTINNGLYFQLGSGRDFSLEFGAAISGGKLNGTSVLNMNTPYLIDTYASISSTLGSGSMSLFVDGAFITGRLTSVTTPISLTTGIYLMDHLSNVGIIEMPIMMIYNRVLSSTEVQLIRNYLSRKLGLNPFRQSATGYYTTLGASISAQILTQVPILGQNYVDLSITSHNPSVTGIVSGSQISYTIQYANYNPYGQTATGVFMDYTLGVGFAYQTGSRPVSYPIAGNTSLLRFNLSDMGTNTTGQLVVTGIITGLSGVTVGLNSATILRLNNSIYTQDVLNTNDVRVAGGVLIYATGSIITGTTVTGANLSGVSPLLVLRGLMTRYTAIITRANPPLIMSDVANSPYLSHIATMVNNGLMIGYNTNGRNRFGPQKHLTRAELAIILGRIASLQSSTTVPFVFSNAETRFSDVAKGSNYERFVAQIDSLGRADKMTIGVGKTNLLYFNPNQKVTQTQMRAVLGEVLRMRGYDAVILDRFPSGNGPVTRGETAYLLAELIWNDPNIVLGNNHRLLSVIVRKLETMTGNVPVQRLITQRILDNVGRTDPLILQSVGLMGNGLQRDLTDSLSGSITPKSSQSLPSLYSVPVGGGANDPFEALLLEWSK